ncbi:protein-disulfide reductase DsbD family protein [Polaribacter dokdonensis]|uniref:Thiol:disulfide interchange protein DsbD n=1 Tax=Polaribacter dokdonensis DSW-5 TaxID=1300348 RepID=A0A0N0CF59_9FLAO|nr:cytochrome c biogenesis protein CcdA [Polaribacter dokdonensis]KOY51408.1 Thiol:disulfide interchange protein DsbD [Polaribacter dokdonensis DSW-5]SEE12041.1 thiol:disulfide interchange protein DsbD [Polaribacter dokdonensis DSW-5]
MKKFITLFIFLTAFITKAQTESDPIKIDASINKISDTEYDIVFNAKLYKGWYLYSQYNPENASLPLEISIPENATGYKLVGNPQEEDTFKKYSDVWEVEEVVFKDKAKITQRIQLTNKDITQIKINFFGQVCETACINIDEDFTLSLTGSTIKETIVLDEKSKLLTQKLKLELKNKSLLKSDSDVDSESSNGLFSIFFLGFVGGLLALLTPCVFPMIPLTVSFFTKQTNNKRKGVFRAILYGFFIVFIYILLSLPFHFLDNLDPEILNTISTNVWLNIFFFAVLVFFAFSFFGFYEITLPSSWGNKMDSASSVGGILGIFFMALTLAIVSFSCTGPILGSLLAGSLTADGGATQLTAGMTGFGLALALPFALFALFPNWLNALPKSGGWMNTTKVVLGFLELALAFKFLSNADLVAHWDILKREIFIGIWIVIFIGLALYIFAKIKFPHDSPVKKLSFSRISFGTLVIAFIIYLGPGVLKNPTWNLSLLSGFPPPQFYSIYEQENDCPLGLDCYKDFDEGLAKAKAVNKPILLDFTGWACVNCRKMEENVWSELDIFRILKNDYILISLYVDDNEKELPENQQFDFLKENGKLKQIKTVGDKWSTFQVINFKNASQPYYVLLSPDLEVLNSAQQYTNRDTYYTWLKDGLENFNTNK